MSRGVHLEPDLKRHGALANEMKVSSSRGLQAFGMSSITELKYLVLQFCLLLLALYSHTIFLSDFSNYTMV